MQGILISPVLQNYTVSLGIISPPARPTSHLKEFIVWHQLDSVIGLASQSGDDCRSCGHVEAGSQRTRGKYLVEITGQD
jgi:hypothetical protein